MKINSSILGLSIASSLSKTTNAISRSLERLNTGKRVNSPSDDVATFATSTGLQSQVRGLAALRKGINRAVSMLDTADVAMSSQMDLVQRMKEIATEASSGILSVAQRSALQSEFQQLLDQYQTIANETEFDGRKLLNGSQSDISLMLDSQSKLNLSLPTTTLNSSFTKKTGTGAFSPNYTSYSAVATNYYQNGDGYDVADSQAIDVNNDGWLDVISAFKYGAGLLLNDGSGTISFNNVGYYYVASGNATNVRAWDFALNGYVDLATFNYGSVDPITTFVNDGSNFYYYMEVNPSNNVTDVEFEDVLGGDGIDDLVYLDDFANAWAFQGFGDGSFDSTEYSVGSFNPINVVTTADLDQDGNVDTISNSSTDVQIDYTVSASNPNNYYSTSSVSYAVTFADLNGDQVQDLISSTFSNVVVKLGRGDGTYGTAKTRSVSTGALDMKFADVNGDGVVDMVVRSNYASQPFELFIGKGDGTFSPGKTYNPHGSIYGASDFDLADVNGDGRADLVSGNYSQAAVYVNLGKADGTFAAASSYAIAGAAYGLRAGDLNNDGSKDIIASTPSGASFSVLQGNGTGTYSGYSTFSSAGVVYTFELGDVNNDSILDVVGPGHDSQLSTFLGVGNGNFNARKTSSLSGSYAGIVKLADLNGDGNLDVVYGSQVYSFVASMLGNGSGVFTREGQTLTTGTNLYGIAVGNLNSDKALDVILASPSTTRLYYYTGIEVEKSVSGQMKLSTAENARTSLSTLDEVLKDLEEKRAGLAANRSRLEHNLSWNETQSEALSSAEAAMTDVDLAEETAELTKLQILQQVQVAMLSQANMQLKMVLNLLYSGR